MFDEDEFEEYMIYHELYEGESTPCKNSRSSRGGSGCGCCCMPLLLLIFMVMMLIGCR